MLKRFMAAGLISAVVFGAAPGMAAADDEALVTFKTMSLSTALELAEATLADCRKKGYQIAVAVVDRFGNTQVVLRDRFAGPHTPDTAERKAWTAVSFRTSTLEMSRISQAGEEMSPVRFVTNALMIGGGVGVESAGSLVGAVGVSGAPGGEADDGCARAGIEKIQDKLDF